MLAALGDELGVIQEAIEAEAGIDLAESLLLQVRQRYRPAAEGRPDQDRGVEVDQMLDHAQPPRRQAGVVAVLTREPGVEVDPALHCRSLVSVTSYRLLAISYLSFSLGSSYCQVQEVGRASRATRQVKADSQLPIA